MTETRLSTQTIERLIQYRKVLMGYEYLVNPYVFSHHLAQAVHTKPTTVRRDLMMVGATGDVKQGYEVNALIASINHILDKAGKPKVCIVGGFSLEHLIIEQLERSMSGLSVVAHFYLDAPPESHAAVPCFPLTELPSKVKQLGISLCVLAVSHDYANDIAQIIVESGIQAILNFTSARLQLPKHIVVEDYDMASKLELLSWQASKQFSSNISK